MNRFIEKLHSVFFCDAEVLWCSEYVYISPWLVLFLSPRHHLLLQGTTCKAWPRVNSVAFPRFSLFSKPVELFSSSKSLCSSFLSLCIASIAIQTTLRRWSLNPHLKCKFLGTVGWLNTCPHYQWGGFRIRSVNFWERSDSWMHKHYHSAGLAQARPK